MCSGCSGDYCGDFWADERPSTALSQSPAGRIPKYGQYQSGNNVSRTGHLPMTSDECLQCRDGLDSDRYEVLVGPVSIREVRVVRVATARSRWDERQAPDARTERGWGNLKEQLTSESARDYHARYYPRKTARRKRGHVLLARIGLPTLWLAAALAGGWLLLR